MRAKFYLSLFVMTMLREIKDVRKQFLKKFTLTVILETLLRFMICVSFTNKIYAFILAGILILFVLLYMLYVKEALEEHYAAVVILSFYFITHFAYALGTYQFVPIMLLWLLVTPIAGRIYFSNKISLILCIFIGLLIFLIVNVSPFSGLLNHYKDIVLDYYGVLTAQFIINIFVLILLLYFVLAIYYLRQALIIEYSSLKKRYNIELETSSGKESFTFQDPAIFNGNDISIESRVSNIQTIKDARLFGIFQSIIDYMEESECFLNSEYTLEQLSVDLKTNRIALSNSLNHIGKTSFKDLLNKYRVNKAKEFFLEDAFSTKNIKQVYMSAGFKYYTTFNRVFIKHEGITPTEYIINVRANQGFEKE